MNNVARAFDEESGKNAIHNFPRGIGPPAEHGEPWSKLHEGEMPPMMFQLRFSNGSMVSFAYSDLREVRFRDAGCVQLFLVGLRQLVVTMEGRHLTELANLLSSASIRWIEEADPRDVGKPESVAEIVKISVEEVVD